MKKRERVEVREGGSERGWKRVMVEERERERRKREKLRENWDHFGNYLSMVTTLTFVDICKVWF